MARPHRRQPDLEAAERRMSMNAECRKCGVTAADLPFEEMGMTLEEASEQWFERVGSDTFCQACAIGLS